MTIEELKEALYNATNGTYIMPGTTTLMGYIKEYDEKGREVSVNPNYLDYEINICGTNYKITKHKWDVYVWKPEFRKADYTWCWKDNVEEYVLTIIDTKPDYVKEYEAKQEAEFTERKKEFVEKGEYICTLVDLAIVRKVKLGNGITKYTHIAEKKWENVKSVKYLRDWELRPMYKALSKYVEEVPNINITLADTTPTSLHHVDAEVDLTNILSEQIEDEILNK